MLLLTVAFSTLYREFSDERRNHQERTIQVRWIRTLWAAAAMPKFQTMLINFPKARVGSLGRDDFRSRSGSGVSAIYIVTTFTGEGDGPIRYSDKKVHSSYATGIQFILIRYIAINFSIKQCI